MARKSHTTVGVLAHVDAGKTTVSEQILYRGGVLRTPGRVDAQNAFLDHWGVERRRGITVFADQAEFCLGERAFTLLDTPGHVDFAGEMERCLSVLDCALLVVSAVEGVQAHTETLWRMLRSRGVPVMVFVNKTDREGADVPGVLKQLRGLGGFFLDFSMGFSPEGDFSQELSEALAGEDGLLFERYFSTGYEREAWLESARRLLAGRKLFPVFSGCALKGEGIEKLLDGLRLLAPCAQGDPEAPFSGKLYKVRHEKGGRVAYLKVTQGTLRPRDVVQTPAGEEKCGELRLYNGGKWIPIKEAEPGSLCAVLGLSGARAGDVVGQGAAMGAPFELRPLLSSQVLYDQKETPPPVMLSHFRELEDEEPLLGVDWKEQSQELEVKVMGEVQLEVLEETVRERWGIQTSFGPCSVLYAETLAAPVVGAGHFEPLRHYAEVHLRLSPGPRGSGIVFESQCPHDALASNWQNLIRTHVLEKRHVGVLTGSPLTDVKVTLLSGRAHVKHTEGGDFREAVYRAIRQGLMRGQNVLLEPYYEFEIEVGKSEAGRVQSDMIRMGAQCQPPEEAAGRTRLKGRGPVRALREYPKALSAFTKGKGRLSFQFGGYEPCRDQQAVVDASGYQPERDLANSPDSVFCSHGAGFPVKWNEVSSYMHLPMEE